MRQSRKPEQLNSFTSSSGTASSPAVVAAPPPSRRRNQQETLNIFAASPASPASSPASLTRSAAVRGAPESLNLFASAGRDVVPLRVDVPPRPRVELPPRVDVRPRVDVPLPRVVAIDYGMDDDDDDDAGDARPPPPPPPLPPATPPRQLFPRHLRVRDPLVALSPIPREFFFGNSIKNLTDEMATLDPSILILFQREVSLTPQQIFVNIMPRPSNRLRIGYEDYVGSVLQFIFTNKIWRQFFTIKGADIYQTAQRIVYRTQNPLVKEQVLLFIYIIKYILILYISGSTDEESRDDDCLITWTDVAMTAYDVLCKHLMIIIHSITHVPINSFETLLSAILDCMPDMLRPSVTSQDIMRSSNVVPTKFIKLPTVITSLENHLRNITVFSEDYFVVFYDNGQDIPDMPEEFDFGALDDMDCPGTVTLQTGVVYRKLIHIDSRYSAEIASPTSPNGEVMFVTNRTGVVPREVGGGLKQSFQTALSFGPKTKKCGELLNLIFARGRSRLVVMYEKTTVPPQGRAMRVIDAANTLLAPVTGRRVAAAISGPAAAAFGYGWHQSNFDLVN